MAGGRLKEFRLVWLMMTVHSIFNVVPFQRQEVDHDAARSDVVQVMESLETKVNDIAANPSPFSLAPTALPNIVSFDWTLGSCGTSAQATQLPSRCSSLMCLTGSTDSAK
jgi:hypothetical protein